MSSRKRKRKQKQKQQRKSSPSGKPSGKQVCGGAEPGDLIPSHDALEELTNDRDYKNIRKSADAGSVPTKLTGLAGLAILTPVAFFAALAVCVRVFVQPELIYHSFYRLIASAPRFQIGWAFCRESLTTVGGPLAYLYGFLSHCFYYPWVGTLILTLVAGLLWLVNRMLLKVTRAYDPPLLCYLYAIFLLAGAISYNHLLLVALSVLTALAVLVGYIWTIGASRPRAGMVFTVGLAVVFWGAGSAAILFGLLAAFYELTVRRRVILAGAFAASTLVVYYLSTVQFELPICFVQSMARSVDTR
ncbi:MAG: hypothetical protein HN350_18285 [Phycisphaerales bacterium]|nr:hypothetical protein [Phycisphaerales bacterium]